MNPVLHPQYMPSTPCAKNILARLLLALYSEGHTEGETMDFQKLVTEILDTGITQTELAKRCGHGTTQGHISAIYTGRRGDKVGYQLGDALVRIHRRAMKSKPADQG
jgi:hypothetical protein